MSLELVNVSSGPSNEIDEFCGDDSWDDDDEIIGRNEIELICELWPENSRTTLPVLRSQYYLSQINKCY